MSKFVVAATVDDPHLEVDAKFRYSILDNRNYVIDKHGGVETAGDYIPKIGDKFTVEVSYISSNGFMVKTTKTFTVRS